MENAFYVEPPFNTRINRLGIDLILLKPVAIGTLIRPVGQSECAIAIGQHAGYYQQGACAVAIGEYAGHTSQGADALALAPEAGAFRQGTRAVALGVQAGQSGQQIEATALGAFAGVQNQGAHALALGDQSGHVNQGAYAIAIGHQAGKTNQPEKSIVLNATGAALDTVTKSSAYYVSPVAPGTAGKVLYYDSTSKEVTFGDVPTGAIPAGNQPSEYLFWNGSAWDIGTSTIRLGRNAGQANQGSYAIALGYQAGMTNQPEKSIVLNATGAALSTVTKSQAWYVAPVASGTTNEVLYYDSVSKEILVGSKTAIVTNGTTHSQYLFWNAGTSTWSVGGGTVRLGEGAGVTQQQTSAVALGLLAGHTNQGSYAIAIGREAGMTNQPEKSIVLNATGAALSTVTQSEGLYVAPVQNKTAPQALFYNPVSKEISYSTPTFTGSLAFQTYTYAYFQARDAVLGKFMFTDCADKDAFYRLRVSEPTTLYEGNTIYDANPVAFDNDVTANASISGPGATASMTLTVNAGSTINEYAARQTHFYAKYQPGKSFLAMFSFCLGGAVSGVAKRVGFYDVDNSNANTPNNGVLLEYTSSGLAWWVYKGDGTSQTAIQSAWNVDPLNGLGPSGITLNPLNNLLGFVDLEWLGVGRVRVGFFIGGVPVICHTFNNTSFTSPYLNNPFLPVRYEVRRVVNSPTAAASLTVSCCTILSEGGYEPIGIVRTFQSGELSISNTETKYVVAVRLTSAYPRAIVSPVSIEIVSDLTGGANIAYYSVYLWRPSSSAVPASTTWTAVSTTLGGSGSMVEYSNPGQSGATDLYTQMVNDTLGVSLLVERGAVNSTSKTSLSAVSSALAVAQSSIDRANRDIYLVVINNNSAGTNKKYTALFTWREI